MPQSTAHRDQAPQEAQPSSAVPNQPVEKFTDGPVHVSIWENNGVKGAFRSATIELRFKDDKDQWRTGRSYSASNLKHLESAAREARARIETWQQANKPKPAPQR